MITELVQDIIIDHLSITELNPENCPCHLALSTYCYLSLRKPQQYNISGILLTFLSCRNIFNHLTFRASLALRYKIFSNNLNAAAMERVG